MVGLNIASGTLNLSAPTSIILVSGSSYDAVAMADNILEKYESVRSNPDRTCQTINFETYFSS